jgi:hypothetical protein
MYRCFISYYVRPVYGQPVGVTTRIYNNRGALTAISDVTTGSIIFSPMAEEPLVGQGLLIIEASR